MIKRIKRKIKYDLILRENQKLNDRFGLRGTILKSNGSDQFSGCSFECSGENNCIELKGNVNLTSSAFFINGKNNRVVIGEGCYIGNAVFWIEDDNNLIEIGRGTSFNANCNLTCTEGHKLVIGERCLFSTEIVFQVGDGHGIFNSEGKRLNWTEDIVIGDRVWIGKRATVLKGACIPSNSVVGTGSIVTKKFTEENIVIAGVPAKKVKDNIVWKKDRNE